MRGMTVPLSQMRGQEMIRLWVFLKNSLGLLCVSLHVFGMEALFVEDDEAEGGVAKDFL